MNQLKLYFRKAVMLFLVNFMIADLNPVQNQNYMFWVLGQGFFSGYYQSSATLAGVGENSYVFTEDALVRDLAVIPDSAHKILAATNSGMFLTRNGGQTWSAINGTGNNVIPEQPEANLTNISEIAYQHRQMINTVAIDTTDSQESWWIGLNDDGVYLSEDQGVKWKKKSTGLPAFNGNKPDVYKLLVMSDGSGIYAATFGGIFFKSGSQFKTNNVGFPDPATTDWPSIPVYDAERFEGNIIMATDYGLYKGSVEKNLEDKLPISSGTAIIDTSFYIYTINEVADSVKTTSFTWNWETGDTAWVYNYFATYDTVSIHLGLGVSDKTSIETKILDQLNVNIFDKVKETYWKSKVAFSESLNMFVVEIDNDMVYSYNENLFDVSIEDSIVYANYDIDNLSIHVASDQPVNDLVIDSNGIIYYSTNMGVFSYNSINDTLISYGLSGYIINDLKLSKNESILYAASSIGVLSYNLELGQNWNNLSPKIHTLNTADSINYFTTSILISSENDVFAGCGNALLDDPRTVTYRTGGVLKSIDSGINWASSNIGLTHRSINQDDVEKIITAFEDSTNTDSEIGIYDMITAWYGNVPDIDDDDHVVILIADMDDNAYNSTSDLIIQGYFNPPDQLATDIYSNKLDIIYIDSDPQDPGESMEGIARALSRLISYNYDPIEEEWVLTGLEHFAPYIIGHKSAPSDDVYTIANNNSLMFGDSNSKQSEYDQLFTLIEYISEHYLDSDPYMEDYEYTKSISAIVQNQLQGITGINDVIITSTDSTSSFEDVFTNWALAVHFDNPDISFNDGLYGFSDIDVSVSPSTYPWGESSGQSPYKETIKNWSAKYMQTKKWVNGSDKAPAFNQETLMFNADDASDIQLAIIKQTDIDARDASSKIDFPEFDELSNRVLYVDWNDFGGDNAASLNEYQYFALVAICREAATDAGGAYVVHDDSETINVSLKINQNSQLLNFLDVYSFTDNKGYGDGGLGVEGSKIMISDGSSIISSFNLSDFFVDAKGYIYHTIFNIESLLPVSTSEFLFITSTESIGGVKAYPDTSYISIINVENSTNRIFNSKWNGFSLEILNNDISNSEIPLMIISNDNESLHPEFVPLSNSLSFTNSPIYENAEIKLSFEIPKDIANIQYANLMVLYDDGDIINKQSVNISNGLASVSVNGSGNFQLGLGSQCFDELPNEFILYQNYPNPFNPSTNIQFSIPYDTYVSLQVFDILGREVSTIVDKNMNAGSYFMDWDGTDSKGVNVASGIYYYQLKSGDLIINKQMVMLK